MNNKIILSFLLFLMIFLVSCNSVKNYNYDKNICETNKLEKITEYPVILENNKNIEILITQCVNKYDTHIQYTQIIRG